MSRPLVRAAPPAPAPATAGPTRTEQATKLIGRIATFFPTTGAIVLCRRLPNTPRYAGQVIAATFTGPTQRGAIPDYSVTIRGRTGKTATVSLTENFVSFFDKWEDATNDTKPQT